MSRGVLPWLASSFICAASIALAPHVLVPEGVRPDKSTDYLVYHQPVARRLLLGHGLTLPNGAPAASYPPGYPMVLAAAFLSAGKLGLAEPSALLALTSLCAGASAALIFSLAAGLWERRKAFLCFLAWCAYPPNQWLFLVANSEVLFLPLTLGAIACLWAPLKDNQAKVGYFFCAGLLLGCAALVRPMAIGLGAALAAATWFALPSLPARRRLALALALLAGNLLAIAPWQIALRARTGKGALLALNGPASVRDGLTFAVTDKGYRERFHVPQDVRSLMRDFKEASYSVEDAGDMAEWLGREFLRRPVSVVKLLAIKSARCWYGTDSGRFEAWLLPLQFLCLALMLYALPAAWRMGGAPRRMTLLIGASIAYSQVMATLVLSILRYMVPALGLLFILLPTLWVKAPQERRPLA